MISLKKKKKFIHFLINQVPLTNFMYMSKDIPPMCFCGFELTTESFGDTELRIGLERSYRDQQYVFKLSSGSFCCSKMTYLKYTVIETAPDRFNISVFAIISIIYIIFLHFHHGMEQISVYGEDEAIRKFFFVPRDGRSFVKHDQSRHEKVDFRFDHSQISCV